MLSIHSLFTRRVALIAAALLLFASACGSSNDPRLGEDGNVRFVGGGCTSSTTLAVGSSVELKLESATEDPLPGELAASSDAPSVITAKMGLEPNTLELKANAQGEAKVTITASGDELDSLPFMAAPAGLVKHTAEPRVFMGGAVDVVVNDVFGDCGANEECRLLGHSFLEWRVEPPEAGQLVIDFDGVATFRAKSEGTAKIIGKETSRAKDLLEQPLEVVPVAEAKSLTAMVTTIPFDPDAKGETASLPGSVTRTEALSLRVDCVLMDGSTMPISWRDVDWKVQGDEIAVEAPESDAGDRFSRIFLTGGTGKMTLVANVAMLNLEQSFDLTLK